jgi:hypothetical protein
VLQQCLIIHAGVIPALTWHFFTPENRISPKDGGVSVGARELLRTNLRQWVRVDPILVLQGPE